jgi:hypothetical protein
MNASDYILNGVLILLVIRQIRGRRLTPLQFLIPLGIVTWAAVHYLHGIPTAGNDLVLAIGGAVLGIALGTACGLLTRVVPDEHGVPVAYATGWAAALWILGVGARMGFSLYAEHGGGDSIVRFSAAHHVTSIEAWVAGLILMALAEVISRSVVLAVRSGVLKGLVAKASGQSLLQDRETVLQ